jgi:hypothetical protein
VEQDLEKMENLYDTELEPSPYSDFVKRLKGRAGEGKNKLLKY